MLPLTDKKATARLRSRLLRWYDHKRRDLPWRRTRDPYSIWVSEIMLQQTRVAVVLNYYQRFLQLFPDVNSLAGADISAVLAAWSGLGYYRRARALHEAARRVVAEHGGAFPRDVDGLRALPGIGRYTAAAVASIAFDQPAAVVDGNVERVIRRMWGGGRDQGNEITGAELWRLANQLVSHRRPGDFNQAIMELGATVCLPGEPLCLSCPVYSSCATRGPSARRTRQPRRRVDVHYRLALRRDSVFVVRRSAKHSLMPDMWELPKLRSGRPGRRSGSGTFTLRHSITVTDFKVTVSQASAPRNARGCWVPIKRLPTLPLTGLTRKILRQVHII
ncbi:MAG TPA: A/G-specific adenine glycosylase [Terriglobales bacterium]|nr:A/G-specific adenine glycosylase [Terriglobales bacterium]